MWTIHQGSEICYIYTRYRGQFINNLESLNYPLYITSKKSKEFLIQFMTISMKLLKQNTARV